MRSYYLFGDEKLVERLLVKFFVSFQTIENVEG